MLRRNISGLIEAASETEKRIWSMRSQLLDWDTKRQLIYRLRSFRRELDLPNRSSQASLFLFLYCAVLRGFASHLDRSSQKGRGK